MIVGPHTTVVCRHGNAQKILAADRLAAKMIRVAGLRMYTEVFAYRGRNLALFRRQYFRPLHDTNPGIFPVPRVHPRGVGADVNLHQPIAMSVVTGYLEVLGIQVRFAIPDGYQQLRRKNKSQGGLFEEGNPAEILASAKRFLYAGQFGGWRGEDEPDRVIVDSQRPRRVPQKPREAKWIGRIVVPERAGSKRKEMERILTLAAGLARHTGPTSSRPAFFRHIRADIADSPQYTTRRRAQSRRLLSHAR